MLILTRRPVEMIRIGEAIEVWVMAVSGNQVRIGIKAPPEVKILREELVPVATQSGKTCVAGHRK